MINKKEFAIIELSLKNKMFVIYIEFILKLIKIIVCLL